LRFDAFQPLPLRRHFAIADYCHYATLSIVSAVSQFYSAIISPYIIIDIRHAI
jgi:hypothetical protein